MAIGTLRTKAPYFKLVDKINEIITDGFVAQDEAEGLIWLCRSYLDHNSPYYDVITASAQQASGFLAGISTDKSINIEELTALGKRKVFHIFDIMITRFILLLALAFCFSCVEAQDSQKRQRVYVKINRDIQSLNQEESDILGTWEDYLNTIDTINYHSPELWASAEKEKYWFPDIEIIEIARRTKMFRDYSPVLLSIQNRDSVYVVKTAFMNQGKDLHSIFNVIVSKDLEGRYTYSRYQDYYTANWESIQVGAITFYCRDKNKFNYIEAQKSAYFGDSLANLFNCKQFRLKFYVFKNTEERLRAQGYDYTYLMYNTIQASSENDVNNRIINSGKGTEYDAHEIAHTYLNQIYWNSISNFVDEGVATFLGGNIEKSKSVEADNLRRFLDRNKDLNLNNLVSIKKMSENKTNIMYALSSFMCKKIYEKAGMDGIKRLCLSGSSDKDIYPVIERILGVRQSELNTYIRKEIEKEK